MSKGKIMFLRSYPSVLNFDTYNIQQFGMGKAFNELGYDFDFYTYTNTNPTSRVIYENDNGTKTRCIEIKGWKLSCWGIIPQLLNKRKLAEYDAIICQEYYQIMSFLLCSITNKVSIYAGPYWNMFRSKAASWLYDLLFVPTIRKRAKCVFTKSVLMSDFLEKKGFDSTTCVGVALDIDRFLNDCSIDQVTESVISCMKENPCIMYVGRIDPNKNFNFLCKVYEEMLDRNKELKLLVIGKSITRRMNNPKRLSYYDQILNTYPKNVRDGIIHIDKIANEQLRYVYPHAKCLLLPSINEVFGMVQLEAMYLGCPVVSSVNGGSTTLIENGVTGFAQTIFDEIEWANTISSIISDDSLSERIKQNSKRLVLERYVWSAIVKKMIDNNLTN